MGGCGGFNTGFASVEKLFGGEERPAPSFVWLVDDDVDLPPDALANLVEAMESDSTIGLVGSRTCDIANRTRTIETTIYFNSDTGAMQDDAPVGHRRHESHRAWIATVGGPRGQGGATGYRGLMEVDVVSACSMLARWKAVVGDGEKRGVGFWDQRYFIYCDDADWCLRFAKAGWRVVLNLDAVVFHTPWNLKLTPARIYYANRNRLWMVQKTLPTDRLRSVTRRMMRSFLIDSLHAALHRRLFHAHIILQTGLDAANNVGGKTGSDGPAAVPITDALREAGCLDGTAQVAVICNVHDSLGWLSDLQSRVAGTLKPGESAPKWLPIVRNDVPKSPAGAIVYGRHLASRLKKQLWALVRRPKAVLVFDQINDFPVLFAAPWTLHVDHKKPEIAQLECDGWGKRIGFGLRWMWSGMTLMRYAKSVKPFASETRYG
jgi:GT2 family glycosyltransferase